MSFAIFSAVLLGTTPSSAEPQVGAAAVLTVVGHVAPSCRVQTVETIAAGETRQLGYRCNGGGYRLTVDGGGASVSAASAPLPGGGIGVVANVLGAGKAPVTLTLTPIA